LIHRKRPFLRYSQGAHYEKDNREEACRQDQAEGQEEVAVFFSLSM
jgi:hypothetical protein